MPAAHDRLVVGKRAITVQLLEIGEDMLHIIKGIWTLRVARHLGNLPRRKLAVDILGQRLALALEAGDLLGNIDCRIVLNEPKLFDLRFKFGDRLLKIEECCFIQELPATKAAILHRAASLTIGC